MECFVAFMFGVCVGAALLALVQIGDRHARWAEEKARADEKRCEEWAKEVQRKMHS